MDDSVTTLVRFLPLLIPLMVIQVGLMVAALIHILKHNTYKTGNRTLWILICLFVNTIGPILYFVLGRGED